MEIKGAANTQAPSVEDWEGGKEKEQFNRCVVRLQGSEFQTFAKDHFEKVWAKYARPSSQETPPAMGKMTIQVVPKTNLVTISANHEDPLLATFSANAAALFIRKDNHHRFTNATAALQQEREDQTEKRDSISAELQRVEKERLDEAKDPEVQAKLKGRYERLLREKELNATLLEALEDRIEQAETKADEHANVIKIVERATPPTHPLK